MTLEVFSRDVVPIIQLFLMLFGLVSLIFLWVQNRQTNRWNRLNSPHNFIDVQLLAELQKNYFEAYRELKINPKKKELTDEDAKLIISDDKAFIATSAYLNYMENLCTAVNIGSVDSECVYAVHAKGVQGNYNKFRSFIDLARNEYEDDKIFIEIETVAGDWAKKDYCPAETSLLSKFFTIKSKPKHPNK